MTESRDEMLRIDGDLNRARDGLDTVSIQHERMDAVVSELVGLELDTKLAGVEVEIESLHGVLAEQAKQRDAVDLRLSSLAAENGDQRDALDSLMDILDTGVTVEDMGEQAEQLRGEIAAEGEGLKTQIGHLDMSLTKAIEQSAADVLDQLEKAGDELMAHVEGAAVNLEKLRDEQTEEMGLANARVLDRLDEAVSQADAKIAAAQAATDDMRQSLRAEVDDTLHELVAKADAQLTEQVRVMQGRCVSLDEKFLAQGSSLAAKIDGVSHVCNLSIDEAQRLGAQKTSELEELTTNRLEELRCAFHACRLYSCRSDRGMPRQYPTALHATT
jgi:hypothetical protein